MRYSSGDVEQTFGDMQRRAWAMDTNVEFVIVVGVIHMGQLAQEEKEGE